MGCTLVFYHGMQTLDMGSGYVYDTYGSHISRFIAWLIEGGNAEA